MAESEMPPEIVEKVKALTEKYRASGQDLATYLEGLRHTDYLKYWDYIQLDVLLNLQVPRTTFPDEMIFIVYHQTTELYFKLVRHELSQLAGHEAAHGTLPPPEVFLDKVQRLRRYFEVLTQSFVVMVEGLSREQFLKFRMALLPSSGFQSVQYRLIEVMSTDFINLVDYAERDRLRTAPLEAQYEHVYWKQGATELATAQKTLTLRHFEEHYGDEIVRTARAYRQANLWQLRQRLSPTPDLAATLDAELKHYDALVNVNWPLMHFKAAVHHLHRDPEVIAATGGTNWQKYLPPRYQLRRFFPDLWDEGELEAWGKQVFRAATAVDES